MPEIVYKKIVSTEPVVQYVNNVISQKLAANQTVLWLVPGGSAIKVAAEVSQQLPQKYLSQLTVTLTDERYGPIGHTDSNWPQLESSGFKTINAVNQPVLIGQNLESTAENYSQILEEDFKKADYNLALIGMGPDGHICGIKPGSPAIGSDQLTAGYKWDDFVRLTITGKALKMLDEIVVYAVGSAKWPQLDALDREIEPNSQPAQLLKGLKKVIIFNDYKGEPT